MMRSMFSGVAGLRTHQTRMDVIGNNIANVNTIGYKAGTVTFKEIFAQTIQGASSANADTGRGGTNPMQIGLGVTVSSIDNLMTQGAAQSTDNPLDLMINGNAFFVVGDSESGFYFTRAGSFRLDQSNLVTASGLKVYGWPAVDDDQNPGQMKINKGQVQPLEPKASQNLFITPEVTKNATFEGNLNMDEGRAAGGILKTVDFYDSLGNYYKLEYTFEYDDTSKEWTMTPAAEITRNEISTIDVSGAGLQTITLKFKTDGTMEYVSPPSVVGDPTSWKKSFEIPALSQSVLGIEAITSAINVDMKGTTQFEKKTDIKGMSMDGCPPGSLIGFSIGPDGKITGSYSNGRNKLLGQIVVANFRNPAGLEKVGDNLFVTSPNSGSFDGIGDDPSSGGQSLAGGRLEMSNVDLSREFTDMIITQRGFQANSRVITTSDEMLQELVRLK